MGNSSWKIKISLETSEVLLNWAQDGTYEEMISSRLPKEIMLEIARSMK